jgi:hypothetical protein
VTISRRPGLTAAKMNRPFWRFFNSVDRASAIIVTADATAHTKGAYVEAIAATSADANFIAIGASAVGASGTVTRMLLDVAIGGAASEVVVIPDINIGYASSDGTWPGIAVPLWLPKGTTIWLRNQGSVTSDTASVTLQTFNVPGLTAAPYVLTFGADTAVSGGVSVTAASTQTEIVSSVTMPLAGVVPSIALNGSGSVTAAAFVTSIGVGAVGAETDVPGAWASSCSATEVHRHAERWYPCNVAIPAGSRITASYTRTAAQSIDVIVHGIPYA